MARSNHAKNSIATSPIHRGFEAGGGPYKTNWRLAEGRRVWLSKPPVVGMDFNDVLLGRAYAGIDGVYRVAN